MPITDAKRFTDNRALLAEFDLTANGMVYRNLGVDALYQAAVQRGQARVLASGALHQDTTPNFGRAAKSSFYVHDEQARFDGASLDELIAWGDPKKGQFDNLPLAPAVYQRLRKRVLASLSTSGDLYVTDAWSGRTPASRMAVRVITGRAPSALFARNIFIEPTDDELVGFKPEWTILHAPEVEAEAADGTNGKPFIITDLAANQTIIGGTAFHGQIKKSIFSVQNFRLPLRGVLTMHAGASEGDGGLVAIHAGLSGTGKTTLSNTGHPVADDQIVIEIEAADAEAVVSNMEGGQYAKTENLRRDKEPETFDAIRYGTTAENLAFDERGVANYSDTRITANGRVGYPLSYVETAKASGAARAPQNITFLTADGFGVLPPLARLTVDGGKFHFACGFTSKMPGTEKGVTEPQPTFSAFFGKPFMPLKPQHYTDLLARLMEVHGTQVWLVNTGWIGPSGEGRERVDILVSKAIINAVRDGQIDLSDDNFWYDPVFKHYVPKSVPGVDSALLDPRGAWQDKAAYAAAANKLAGIFQKAIAEMGLPAEVAAAGPAPVG
ncbi:MAG: phosphoenolpyruvate carboxykinase (ATP) [Myxococcales bacterium]|nr:phosphoenolpyruvate carboxykinase (ATP) [Myxococcales bacterium]